MILTLKCGFSCEIEEDAMDDMELLDDLAAVDDGKIWRVKNILQRLMGEEKQKELYEALRDENGRVSVTNVSGALGELMEGMKEGKN